MLAIHSDTSRAYCRVVMHRPSPRPDQRSWASRCRSPNMRAESSVPANALMLDAEYRARLLVPLLRFNEVMGALVVRRKAPGEFPNRSPRRTCSKIPQNESAYPPIAALERTCFGVAFVPFPDSCIAANNQGAPINQSGMMFLRVITPRSHLFVEHDLSKSVSTLRHLNARLPAAAQNLSGMPSSRSKMRDCAACLQPAGMVRIFLRSGHRPRRRDWLKAIQADESQNQVFELDGTCLVEMAGDHGAHLCALTMAKGAPWGSRAWTIQEPPGTSAGPCRISAPRVWARSAAFATLSTAM